jgi:hypothetical protein
MQTHRSSLVLASSLALSLNACELVGDIFKAGVFVGVLAVVLFVAIVIAVVRALVN